MTPKYSLVQLSPVDPFTRESVLYRWALWDDSAPHSVAAFHSEALARQVLDFLNAPLQSSPRS